MPEPCVRRARTSDAAAVAPLLHESAARMYDTFAGGRRTALRLLERAFTEEGNNTSASVVQVAELGGTLAGALAAFPVDEAPDRAGAFLRLALRTLPPWRWPRALWLYRRGAHATPAPPRAALYVDALAVAPPFRRRGVARALLDAAEAEARSRRLPAVALDTALDNRPARALYLRSGFEELAARAPSRELPGFVALVKRLR